MSCTLLLTLVLLTRIHNSTCLGPGPQMQLPAVTLDALDCSAPTKTRYTLLSHVCRHHERPEYALGKPAPVLVVQTSVDRVVSAYRCTRRESVFRDVCAVWSHVKRYGSPVIGASAPVTPDQCHQMVARGTYKREDGVDVDIKLNTKHTYTLVRHGALFLTPNDVACTGSSVTLRHGETVSGIIEPISVTLTVKQISIELSASQVTDLDQHVSIPSACLDSNGCQVGDTAYIIPQVVSTCPLYSVRLMPMSPTIIPTKAGQQNALVNEDHKVLFILGRREPSPAGCNQPFSLVRTQYPQFRIITDREEEAAVHTLAETLPPSALDMDLEIRSSEEYLAFSFEKRFSEQLTHTGLQLCHIAANALAQAELSPFAPDSIIRVRGDILQELQCSATTVTARLGDTRGSADTCSDALPVWHSNRPAWLQPGSHLILQEAEIARTPCQATYPPYFQASSGEILTADPKVRRVDLSLEDLPELVANNDTIIHDGFTTDLIYTSQEVQRFNHLIHFSRNRHRLMSAMTSKACEKGGCGEYQPAEGSSGFSLGQLEETFSHPLSALFGGVEETLQHIGAYCSIVVVFVLMVTVSIRAYRLLRLLRTRGARMTAAEAVKLAFFPADQYAAVAVSNARFLQGAANDSDLEYEDEITKDPVRITYPRVPPPERS